MNIPQSIVSQTKQAIQAHWSDSADIIRTVRENNVVDEMAVYESIRCHFSHANLSPQQQSVTIATATTVFELFVDTEVNVLQGDRVVIRHKNQVFEGTAGMPFNGEFSNSVKIEVEKTS